MTNREYIESLSDELFYSYMGNPCFLCSYATREKYEHGDKIVCVRRRKDFTCYDAVMESLKAEYTGPVRAKAELDKKLDAAKKE